MAIRDRLVEIIFSLKDQFSKPSRKVKGAYKEIGAEAERAESRVRRAGKSMARAFSSVAGRIGLLFGAGAITGGLIKLDQFADSLDKLSKVASKLGTTTEELSKLGFAAEQTGVDTNTLYTALQRLERRVSEAAKGSGVAVKALQELGLEADALNRLTVDEQFRTIADAFEQVESQSDRVRLAFALFDSAGVSLVNTLSGGRAGLKAYGDELERIGGVITTEAANAAAQYNDSLNRLSKHFEAIANKHGPKVLDFFNRLFHQTGLGAGDLKAVNSEIEHLQDLIARADEGEIGAMFRVELATDDLRQRLADLLTEQKKLQEDLTKNQAAAQAQQSAQADQARATELAKTQKHVQSVQAEFDKLVEGPEKKKPAAELDLIDLSGEISKSMSALAQGDFDKAVEDARAAGEMLNRMREAGTEADIVLDGMAMRIRNLAVEAAKEKGGVTIKPTIDTVTLADVQKTLDGIAAPITIPVRLESPAGTAEIEWESAKRGAKL